MGIVRERATQAYAETLDTTTYAETLDTTVSIQVFGTPDDAVLATLAQQRGSGVRLTVKAHHLGGFTRASLS